MELLEEGRSPRGSKPRQPPLHAANGTAWFTRAFRWRRRAFIAVTSLLVFAFLGLQYTMLSRRMDVVANALGASVDGHNNMHAPSATPVTKKRVPRHISDHLRRPVTTRSSSVPAEPTRMYTQSERQEAIKHAMRFAWGNYENSSFGADEVDPISGAAKHNVWGGIACSLVDGMDTLWIMGLTDEFHRARDYVAQHLMFDHLGDGDTKISIFETIIREVGGLLSAFDLSGDDVFKHKATELMDLLMPAFSPREGVFYTYFNPHTRDKGFASWFQYQAALADVGTLQLETRSLSSITGDPKYADAGEAFYKIVQREGSFNKTGLFSNKFDSTTGEFVNQQAMVSIGAMGDSFYEYLLKVFIFSGKRNEDAYLRKLYDDAVVGMENVLLTYSAEDDLYYLADVSLPSLSKTLRMDHLLCFVPGLLALGTLHEEHDLEKNARHLKLAEKLVQTCYQMYHQQQTGLAPDIVSFPGLVAQDPKYKLRPEAVESMFYMYRVTKDHKYRDWGWEIFQSLEKNAKVAHGYGAIVDVRELPAEVENKMESFFLAETLKYHYLLQAPEDLIPLDEYVFNTEAHPLRIRQR